ncbi:hypothetical protein MTO96_044091 [Rhipicephalus appendiculatus]
MGINMRHASPGEEAAFYENRRLRPEAEKALAEIREILLRELANANSGQHVATRAPPSRRRAPDAVSNCERGHLDAIDDVIPGQTVTSLPVQFAGVPATSMVPIVGGSPHARQVGDIGPRPPNPGLTAAAFRQREPRARACRRRFYVARLGQ